MVLPSLVTSNNGSCCEESSRDTDVWLHAISPSSLSILSVNSSEVQSRLLARQAQTSIRYTITGDLHVQASELRAPPPDYFISSSGLGATVPQVRSLAPSRYAGYPALLIAVGCFVFALSVAAIIYLLMVYARYRHSKDRAQRMVVIPRYEPVFVEPNMKQYEVQVLQMSVNMDDIDNNTAKMDFRRNQRFDPGFNLDSVSYITHDTSISSDAGQPSSGSTFRAATVTGRPVVRNLSSRIRQAVEHDKSSDSDRSDGVINPVFLGDSNVMRGYNITTSTPRRVSSFKSPIDATTQL